MLILEALFRIGKYSLYFALNFLNKSHSPNQFLILYLQSIVFIHFAAASIATTTLLPMIWFNKEC